MAIRAHDLVLALAVPKGLELSPGVDPVLSGEVRNVLEQRDAVFAMAACTLHRRGDRIEAFRRHCRCRVARVPSGDVLDLLIGQFLATTLIISFSRSPERNARSCSASRHGLAADVRRDRDLRVAVEALAGLAHPGDSATRLGVAGCLLREGRPGRDHSVEAQSDDAYPHCGAGSL
jgi:hypothetical protein